VATVTWTTDQAIRRLFPNKAYAEWSDPSGEISLLEVSIPKSLCGKKIALLEQPGKVKPIGVRRSTRTMLMGPDSLGQEGDILFLAVANDYVGELERLLTEGKVAK
jgi:trk system potassium uptake protein TrkA